MRLTAVILFAVVILAGWTQAFAQTSNNSLPEPLILTDQQGSYPLGLHLEILEDPAGELTIAEVASPEFDSRFTPSQEEVPNFGFTDSAYWVRFLVRNETQSTNNWLVDVGFANMHFVDLYTPLANSKGFDAKQSGILRPPASRDISHPRIIFELTVPPGAEQTYYMRFHNGASMTLPLTLFEPITFATEFQLELILKGIFVGALLAFIAYHTFLFASLREKSYLYLAIYLASVLVFDTTYAGYLEMYIVPKSYYLMPVYYPLSFAAMFILITLFSNSFLEARKRFPKHYSVNRIILGIWALLLILTPFVSYRFLVFTMMPSVLATLAAILATGIAAWRHQFQSARLYLIAWFGVALAYVITIGVRFGAVESTVLTESFFRVGVIWMAVCWSLALANQINILKAETESTNRDLQMSRHRLSQILEGLPIGVVVYGKDFKPNFVNRRVNDILSNPARNIEPDLSAGRTLADAMNYYSFRVTGTDQVYSIEDFPVYRALKGEPASADDIEADLIDKRVPLEIWASPVRDDTGNVESAVVAFQDITRRKQAEMALRASETHFRVIVENNFDGIAFLDRDRKILYVSPSYKEINGIDAEDMLGHSGIGTIHPDDRSYVAETFQRLMQQSGGRVTEEYRVGHQNGSWVWVETRAMNLLDDPHVQAVVINSRNITERKRTEEELANYRRHLEHIVQQRTEELYRVNERLMIGVAKQKTLEMFLHQRIQWMSAINASRQKIRGAADLPMAFEVLTEQILHILEASSVFIIRLDGREELNEFICRGIHERSTPDAESIGDHLQKDSPLRRKIDLGQTISYSSDEVSTLPAPLQECFPVNSNHSLLLMPMADGATVAGVVGIALPEHMQNLTLIQNELAPKIAYDLLSLTQYATYLDQSRILVAAEERNRLARDLHDSVTQVLFSASLVAEVLPRIWQRDPERAMESLQELRRLTRGALAEMRTMLLELRPSAVAKSPLHELLAQLTEARTSRSELPFRLYIEKTPPLSSAVHAAFYRIAQEALNNVAKHAQANQVTIDLKATPLQPETNGQQLVEVILVIEDDGKGFATGEELIEHLGMGIMRERAADIQADIEIDSQIGQGTRVTLTWCGPAEG